MTPSKVMVIRHAEKPGKGSGAAAGIDLSGAQDEKSLTVEGWQRAGALTLFLSERNSRLASLGLAVPDVIFATGIRQHSKSRRPIQTVLPLAAKLGLSIDQSFSKGDEAALFASAMNRSGVVLISWAHEQIPALANLLAPPPRPVPPDWPVPQDWPDDRYDVVWVFDPPASGGESWRFRQVLQRLLATDRDRPIGF